MLERELCARTRVLKNAGAAAILVAALSVAAIFPWGASAQSVSKGSNAKSAVSASTTQESVSGKELFQQHCASCHFATTTAQKIGPGMKGMYARPFSGGKKVTDASLSKWIEAGGKNMPGFRDDLKPEQIRALISYIKTL